MFRFGDHPLWLNLALFVASAVVIWVAGTKLSRYADAIAERTGVGKAFIGALLLGGITSLPEGATTVTASAIGSAPLAVNNLLGGVAMQVALLAVVDGAVRGTALSARIRKPVVLLQAALLIVVLALVVSGITLGEVGVLGVGAWSAAVFATSLCGFYLIHQHRSHETWEPEAPPRGDDGGKLDEDNEAKDRSTRRLVIGTAGAGLAILTAGYTVARSADALAGQTGLGASFVGVLFLAVATSLPEASTTLSAVRMGQYEMAFSNVLGANILDLTLLFLADAAYRGGPVLAEVGRFSTLAALLALLLTAIYLVALLERRRRVVFGFGIDSVVVLALYGGGMYVLYTLR